MKVDVQELRSRLQTGKQIYQMAKLFGDLGNQLDTTLQQFYDYVRGIPYREDNFFAEIVSRPAYLMDKTKFPDLDCKKKAVLLGAWLNAHGIPWRLIASSERPDKMVHHVFILALINGSWYPIDATYPDYKLFQAKPELTYAEELPE